MVDIVTPSFSGVVKEYNTRLAAFRKNLPNLTEEQLQFQLNSLEETKRYLNDFDIKVTSPLPKTKGRPS